MGMGIGFYPRGAAPDRGIGVKALSRACHDRGMSLSFLNAFIVGVLAVQLLIRKRMAPATYAFIRLAHLKARYLDYRLVQLPYAFIVDKLRGC